MINLFIDSNIWLAFYRLSDEKVDTLNQLYEHVENGDIKLFMNDQVKNEIIRNRDSVINDTIKSFKDFKFNLQAPVFMKDSDLFSELKHNLKNASNLHKSILDDIISSIDDKNLNIDLIIKKFFDKGKMSVMEDDYFKKAKKRKSLGNPPGKENQNTCGDELNWEFLLSEVPDGKDLYFVTRDRDYASPRGSEKIHPFLEREWEEKKNSKIFFYTGLSSFFREKTPEIILENDEKTDFLIAELAYSCNFSQTHRIISEFPKNKSFNVDQIDRLRKAYQDNNQINWIGEDEDVKDFFRPILERHSSHENTDSKNE